MIWELVGMVVAGLGVAGLAMFLRFLTRKRMPRWLIPVLAGAGMLSFQVYSEYTWFSHQRSLLPEGVAVVRTAEESKPWRPWSYLVPQTLRFIAADMGGAVTNTNNPAVIRMDLYLIERRMPAQRVTTVIHCEQFARADYHDALVTPVPGEALSSDWYPLESNDLLLAACH